MSEPVRPVTVDEIAASYAVPTVIVNRFLVTTQPSHFRIAFGESVSPDHPINYRIAVQLTPGEAEELKLILEKLLDPFKEDLAQSRMGDSDATGPQK